MPHRFIVTYDYLCPFARNLNLAVLDGLENGAPWVPTFRPFSLAQAHRDDGDVDVWETPVGPETASGVLALGWSVVVRDDHPDAFPGFHAAMFDARHVDGRDVSDPDVVADVARSVGLDAAAIERAVAEGTPMKALGAEHASLVAEHAAFGVPTLVLDGEAAFVRMMGIPTSDELERILDNLQWDNLNEFKRTRIPR